MSVNGATVELSGQGTSTTLPVSGTANEESEIHHWANGATTKDTRTILCNYETEYTDYFSYDFDVGDELFDVYSIRRIERTFVDGIAKTTVTFRNTQTLQITGIEQEEYGGPFIPYKGMSYSLGYGSWICTSFNDLSKKSVWSVLSINTYTNESMPKAWIIVNLENGTLTFWKREYIN